MSDRAAVIAALTEYTTRPATSHDCRAEPGDTFGRPPFTLLNQHLQTLSSRDELNALIAEVAPLIRADDPFRGASIAINCGTMVEWGGDPDLVFPHLLAALPRHLALARRAHESGLAPGALFDADPDAARASAGLMFLLLATMTVICRKAEYRQALRANPAIGDCVEVLRESSQEADFVAQVLALTDGMELLVLVPAERKGFRVALDAVATNAHLFSLLQASLIEAGHVAGEPLDPEVVAVVRGEAAPTRRLSDHARFNFVTCSGLNADGSLDGMSSLIGLPVEVSPAAIQRFDGVPIVLIGPNVFGLRGWDSDFFANIHDALKSRAEIIEVLPAEQVDEWLDRIHKARR